MNRIIREVCKCEDCPYVFQIYDNTHCDYAVYTNTNLNGTPEEREEGADIPKDCPLIETEVLTKLKW